MSQLPKFLTEKYVSITKILNGSVSQPPKFLTEKYVSITKIPSRKQALQIRVKFQRFEDPKIPSSSRMMWSMMKSRCCIYQWLYVCWSPTQTFIMDKGQTSASRFFNVVLVMPVASKDVIAFIHRKSFKSYIHPSDCFEKLCFHMLTKLKKIGSTRHLNASLTLLSGHTCVPNFVTINCETYPTVHNDFALFNDLQDLC
jgi:hypothetical protein